MQDQRHNNQQPKQYVRPADRKSFYLTAEPNASIVDVYINGDFNSVETHAEFFEELRKASHEYPTARFFISSRGGYVATCSYLIELMHEFAFTITICQSSMASAAAILWSEGDFRVISPNAFIMFHRETFGSFGKSEPTENMTNVNKSIGERLFEKSTRFLTEVEAEKAKLTEVYLDGNTLLERKCCVSYSEYMDRMNNLTPVGTVMINPNTDKMGLFTPDGSRVLTDVYLELDDAPLVRTQYEWLLGDSVPTESETETAEDEDRTEIKDQSIYDRIKTIFQRK